MDWTGNENSIFKTIGASNHTASERESDDYYATDPRAIEKLRKVYTIPPVVWECACGAGHLSRRLIEYGHDVLSTDLVDRGYGHVNIDFLKEDRLPNTSRGKTVASSPIRLTSMPRSSSNMPLTYCPQDSRQYSS